MKLHVIAFLLLYSCNEAKFTPDIGNSGSKQRNAETADAETNPEVIAGDDRIAPNETPAVINNDDTVESFSLAADGSEKLDLIWVVDNSGSMREEINQIDRNFRQFLVRLNTEVDAKVLTVSQLPPADFFYFSFPRITHPKLTQIDVRVESRDPMLMGAAVSCPSTLSHPGTKVCDHTVTHINRPSNVYGAGSSWFRGDARRVYVFVTDYDSTLMMASAFQAAMTKAGSFRSLAVFSFRGIAGQSPCAAATGTQYEILERATGGSAFNICAADWSPAFDRLLQTLTISSPASWTLKKSPNAAKVSLNGTLLKESQYKIEGMQLTLTLKLDRTKENKVQVKYQ
jgi:hypothetical protein